MLITSGAAGDDVSDLAHAPVWGLVRSAQSENPGRFVLVDVTGGDAAGELLAAAVETGEPELTVRDGVLRAPRLVRATVSETGRRALDPAGTVLVTGGNGFLGSSVVRGLAGAGHTVVSADLRLPPEPVPSVEHVVMDVTSASAVDAAFAGRTTEGRGVEVVVHLASSVTPGKDSSRELEHAVDVTGTRHVLDACLARGVRRIVVSSSGAAYGYHPDSPARLSEDDLIEALRAGVNASILTPAPDRDGYRFRHSLVREAVSDDLLPGERSRLNRRYAEALEADPTLVPADERVRPRGAGPTHEPASSWSRHMMLPSLSLNQAARPTPGTAAISPSHCTPGMS